MRTLQITLRLRGTRKRTSTRMSHVDRGTSPTAIDLRPMTPNRRNITGQKKPSATVITYSWKTAERSITQIDGNVRLRRPVSYSNDTYSSPPGHLSRLPCKHPDRHTRTANRARRYSTFDSRRRTTSSSTSPQRTPVHSTFLTLALLDRTFDRRIEAFQQMHSANSAENRRSQVEERDCRA